MDTKDKEKLEALNVLATPLRPDSRNGQDDRERRKGVGFWLWDSLPSPLRSLWGGVQALADKPGALGSVLRFLLRTSLGQGVLLGAAVMGGTLLVVGVARMASLADRSGRGGDASAAIPKRGSDSLNGLTRGEGLLGKIPSIFNWIIPDPDLAKDGKADEDKEKAASADAAGEDGEGKGGKKEDPMKDLMAKLSASPEGGLGKPGDKAGLPDFSGLGGAGGGSAGGGSAGGGGPSGPTLGGNSPMPVPPQGAAKGGKLARKSRPAANIGRSGRGSGQRARNAREQLNLARNLSTAGNAATGPETSRGLAGGAFDGSPVSGSGVTGGGPSGIGGGPGAGSGGAGTGTGGGAPDAGPGAPIDPGGGGGGGGTGTGPNIPGVDQTPYLDQLREAQRLAEEAARDRQTGIMMMIAGAAILATAAFLSGPFAAAFITLGITTLTGGIAKYYNSSNKLDQANAIADQIAERYGQDAQAEILRNINRQIASGTYTPQNAAACGYTVNMTTPQLIAYVTCMNDLLRMGQLADQCKAANKRLVRTPTGGYRCE